MLKQNSIRKNLIVSENPSDEIWDLLRLNVTERYFNNGSKIQYSKNDVNKIQTFYKQSNEFFRSGMDASYLTSPLLHFYSFSLLSKILIMKKLGKKTNTLLKSHGLKFSLENTRSVKDMKMLIKIQNKGTFIELLSCKNRQTPIENIIGKVIDLDDLLIMDIDVFDQCQFYDKSYPLHDFRYKKENDKYVVKLQLAGVKENFEKDKQRYKNLGLSEFKLCEKQYVFEKGYTVEAIFDEYKDIPDFIYEKSYKNESFITSPLLIENIRYQFLQYEIKYLIYYATSNMVRYYPKEWMNLINEEDYSAILKKSLSYGSRSFPNYLLNSLTDDYYSVLPPGINRWK